MANSVNPIVAIISADVLEKTVQAADQVWDENAASRKYLELIHLISVDSIANNDGMFAIISLKGMIDLLDHADPDHPVMSSFRKMLDLYFNESRGEE